MIDKETFNKIYMFFHFEDEGYSCKGFNNIREIILFINQKDYRVDDCIVYAKTKFINVPSSDKTWLEYDLSLQAPLQVKLL